MGHPLLGKTQGAFKNLAEIRPVRVRNEGKENHRFFSDRKNCWSTVYKPIKYVTVTGSLFLKNSPWLLLIISQKLKGESEDLKWSKWFKEGALACKTNVKLVYQMNLTSDQK